MEDELSPVPAIINLMATKKNGNWNRISQQMRDENQAYAVDGAFFIKMSPNRPLYHATKSVKTFGKYGPNSP